MKSHTESAPQPGKLTDKPDFLTELAHVIAAVGTESFYNKASLLLSNVLRCGKRLVMRYSAFDRPAFIVNQALTEEGVAYYLAGLYRVDPLHKLARTYSEPTVVSLRALTTEIDETYLAELVKMSIFDELALILPAYGGVTIALCCERHRVRFEPRDFEIANSLLPTLDALHKLHMDRLFIEARTVNRKAIDESFSNPLVVLDRRGEIAYANDAWSQNSTVTAVLPQIREQIAAAGPSFLQLDSQQVVHWDQLPDDFSLAPGGHLIVVERRSPGPLPISGEAVLDTFCNQQELTPREAEIVRLSFVGLPNAAIAKQLGVSVGTVKNHRWRLYYKLDITSERELFHLFLSTLLSLENSPGG